MFTDKDGVPTTFLDSGRKLQLMQLTFGRWRIGICDWAENYGYDDTY